MRSLLLLLLAGVGTAAALTPHPRLLVTADGLKQLQAAIASGDPTVLRYQAGLLAHAGAIVPLPPVTPPPPGATGILTQVREVIDRLLTLTLGYRLTGNTTLLARARLEMQNVTSWTTWNQVQHTLDTGEAVGGVAITLDWLWDTLPASERDGYISALVDKGLQPLWTAFNERPSWSWWVFDRSNWNCVVR